MLMVTYRSDELHRRHPLRPLLTSWERVRSVRSHRAAPVRAGTRWPPSSPRSWAPRPRRCRPAFDRSGGNAYLVEELAGCGARRRRPRTAAVPRGRAAEPGRRARRGRRRGCCGLPRSPGAVPDRLLAEVAGIGGRGAVRGAARGGRSHLLVVDPSGHGLRLPARADQGRGLRGHAARGAGPAARRLRRGAGARSGPRRRRRGGARRPGLPLVRGPRPAARAARLDRRGPARDRPRSPRPRRCATWSGRWRSGRGCRTRPSAPAWTRRRWAGWPARPPTGPARSTGRCPCSTTPWPSCRPRATRSGARSCSSGARGPCGTPAGRPSRSPPWKRRSPCCPPTR